MKEVLTGLQSTGIAYSVKLKFEKCRFDNKGTGNIDLSIKYESKLFTLDDKITIPHWIVKELKQLIDESIIEKGERIESE